MINIKELFLKILFKMLIPLRNVLYKKKKVYLKRTVKYNRGTTFEGANKIGKNCNVSNSFIGYGTYIAKNSQLNNCSIGRFCSIASDVKVVIGHHPLNPFVSTHPSFFSIKGQVSETYVTENLVEEIKYTNSEKKICVNIGNDVWIGLGVLIMEGVTIGDGAVIGAGSIVTKNVPPYEIWVGNPAHKLKDRFTGQKNEIKKLTSIKWWNWDIETIKKNTADFSDLNIFLKRYE